MKLRSEVRPLKVGDFMSSPVVTVNPDMDFVDAIQVMMTKGIGNLVVADGELVTGVVTERELLQYLALEKTIPNKQVKYIMTQKFKRVTPDTTVLEAARIMISKKTRLLVFQKDDQTGSDQLAGMITASDLMRAFHETDLNPSIKSSMANKIITLRPNSTILGAVKLMLKKGIGSVVVSTNGEPYALFTERDLLNRVLGNRVDIEERVGNYCSHPVMTSKLGIGAKEAAKIMLTNKIKRLPLTKRGKVVAMVTARDLVEAFQRS